MKLLTVACFAVLVCSSLTAQLGKDLGEARPVLGANLSDTQITSGLRAALSLSTEDAINKAGRKDGFWANQTIRIPLPEKMQTYEKGLRMMGQGLKIDEFELSMNRAAEIASQQAGPAFAKALSDLNFSDPRGVLNGTSTAATEYLRTTKSAAFAKDLRPIVEAAMSRTGAVEEKKYLATQVKGLTLGQPVEVDLTTYVLSRTIGGLLQLAAIDESKMRANPAAVAEPRIKKVFSRN